MKTNAINGFLGQDKIEDLNNKNEKNNSKKVLVSKDKSIVERIDKQMITEDGRQLLVG